MFPDGFLWGAATSAYQVEGAVDEDGRGESIWDTFSRTRGRVRDGDTGDVACDHYHRVEEDVSLLASIGVNAYRFSIAWPRIQPTGTGRPNQRGLDHYRRLVAMLRERDVEPVVTLYHWDLPQALEDRGGWPSRDTAFRFAEYAGIVADALADHQCRWITINEPWVAAWLGYGTGVHAPGRKDDRAAFAASHHLLLAHGLATKEIRDRTDDRVGIALNLYPMRPASAAPEDARAAARADGQANRMFLDPLFGRGYPHEMLRHFEGRADLSIIRDGDLPVIAEPIDFLGVNYYTTWTITAGTGTGDIDVPGGVDAAVVTPTGPPVTAMGWPIDAAGLTELLIRLHREYASVPLMITENGAAFDDVVTPDGKVHDPLRVAYLREHVSAARDAIDAGVPLDGYFVWSLLDNFEWAEGYSKRFGLVHVDFTTQVRTPKDSALWYREVARGGGTAA